MEPTINPSRQPRSKISPDPAPAPTVSTSADKAENKQPDDKYPVQFSVDYPDKQSRMLALFSIPFFFIRCLLLIPQFIVIYFISLVAMLAVWFNFLAVLFTGHSSKGLHGFVVGTLRWSIRISSYMYGLTDKYPPFRLDP